MYAVAHPSIVPVKVDFPSPKAKAVFVICFTLVFESTSFKRKAMKYFLSSFCQSFLSLVKRVHSFDIAKTVLFSFRDFYNFF